MFTAAPGLGLQVVQFGIERGHPLQLGRQQAEQAAMRRVEAILLGRPLQFQEGGAVAVRMQLAADDPGVAVRRRGAMEGGAGKPLAGRQALEGRAQWIEIEVVLAVPVRRVSPRGP